MKTFNAIPITILLVFFACATTQAQTLTLAVDEFRQASSYNCATNDIITVLAIKHPGSGTNHPGPVFSLANGVNCEFGTTEFGTLTTGLVFSGVTNISLRVGKFWNGASINYHEGFLTVGIAKQTPASVPANTVVIPSDAKGPVQIALESSSDLVNWNAALPGTYGSTYSNRFFRVRAIAQ